MRWRWLLEKTVTSMHDAQLAIYGGGTGLRDAGFLISAMARPQNLAICGEPSVFDLAAAYSISITRNHPFIDGNKRSGLLAAYVFLSLNGYRLTAPEAEAAVIMTALAAGTLAEEEFSAWLKDNSAAQ
jgi:death-on-curing protein